MQLGRLINSREQTKREAIIQIEESSIYTKREKRNEGASVLAGSVLDDLGGGGAHHHHSRRAR